MPGNMRFMPGLDWDSKDPGRDEIPELRPEIIFFIFSAAQSDQMAAEQKDEQGIFHGAFGGIAGVCYPVVGRSKCIFHFYDGPCDT